MKVQKITLMEAYIIENLRKHGVTDEEIIHINKQAIEQWKTLNEQFDFTILQKLANKTGEQFSEIISHGYTVKFLTLNGLINLVQLKLNKKQGEDFMVHDNGISQLKVDSHEQKEIAQILSPNWRVEEKENGLDIRSAH